MQNFANLFNQWRSQNNNAVLDILDQPGITISRLLDEQSFQSDYKSGNAKIIEFMKYERYEELIEFVTVVGPPDDKKRSYKFPLSACEILSLQNTTAIDFFLPDKPIFVDEKITEVQEVQTQVEVQQPQSQKQESDTNQNLSKQETKNQTEPNTTQTKAQVLKNTTQGVQIQKKSDEVQVNNLNILADQVPKKKTKTVLRKQIKTIQKVVKKQARPLIKKLLQYFDGDVNYTLAGYVSRILTALMNKKPVDLLKYVLQENEMHKIINHTQSRSVGEFIVKVLTHQATLMLQNRKQLFKELLNRASGNSSIEIISNLSAYICEVIEKIAANLKSNNRIIQFNTVFFSLETINQVIKNVMSDEQNVSVYNSPILLTYLTNVPFVLPQDENIINQFAKLGELFIQRSCQKLQISKRSKPALGFGRIKIIQILRLVIKQNVLNAKEIAGKTAKLFPILLNLVKEYDMNNVLHNEVIKIIDIALTEPEGSALNNSVLADDVLLDFISAEWEEDKKIKAGDSIYKSRKGYIAHVINLSVRLRQLAEKNKNIQKIVENPRFMNIYDNFIQKEIFNSKKALAGLLMKKEQKHQILFQKEDILAVHLTFLQKCPCAVFEVQKAPEQVNIEHPDLVEELQKQLEETLVIKSVDEGKNQKETKKEVNVQEGSKPSQEIQGEGKYWATHLEYNIDDLIADL